jgi:regulator of RNase E activity RraA
MVDATDEPIAPETIDRLRRVGTATLSMLLLKRGIKGCFIAGVRALNPSEPRAARFVGEAFTLRFVPAREDTTRPEVLANPDYPQRKAIETVPPGHVLVVDCRGDTRAGVLGGILATRLRARGAAALVADGAVRDAADLIAMPWPVFCAGAAAPASIAVHHAADIQRPIACGGAAVFPGDVLAGDADGVVVVPRALAASLADEAVEQERIERFIEERVAAGAALPGLYPANEETLADYRRWLAAQGEEREDR